MIDVIEGDCRAVLPTLGMLFHTCVTDPPYHLTSGNAAVDWAAFGANGAKRPNIGPTNAKGRGFMGKAWDGGDVAFRPETWRAVYDVLLPGGYLAAFGGTRTWHRMACAIEDAGLEIRDTVLWLYSCGFPKSLNCGEGRGTALKPAFEPIILGRKPLDGTVASNILRHGTGALNIDASRVASSPVQAAAGCPGFGANRDDAYTLGTGRQYTSAGRYPANVIHDGSDEVLAAFAAFETAAPCGSPKKSQGRGGSAPSARRHNSRCSWNRRSTSTRLIRRHRPRSPGGRGHARLRRCRHQSCRR